MATDTMSASERMSDINPDTIKVGEEIIGIPQIDGNIVVEQEEESDEIPHPAPYQLERPILLGLIVDNYIGEYEDNLFSGQGIANFVGGNVYEGTFVRGRMHGKGKYIWANGIEYEGDFRENVIRGQGVFKWTNGCVYEGEVSQGLRSGYGTLRHEASGVSYTGNWLNGLKHGKGRMDYDQDGRSFYEGDWYENMKHGWGVRQYASGNVYEGMWYKHERQGEGKMMWKDRKEMFIGQWEAGIQHGKGKHIWFYPRVASSQYPIRNTYEGDFVRGARNGVGMFMYASGAIYDGSWKDNLKHGPGKFVFKNGRIYEGAFEYDHMAEHPDIIPDRLTTPEMGAIRTRTPTPHESEIYQSRSASVNTMSPSFKVDLSSLEDKADCRCHPLEADGDCRCQPSLPEQLEQVQRVIMHHVTALRKIYMKYATLGNEASPDNTYVLSRMQFWRLLKDTGLHCPEFTLCMMNRSLAGGNTGLSVHDPFCKIMFREFVHHLLALAHLIFKDAVTDVKGSTVANAFNKMVEDKLLIHACKIKGHLYLDARRATMATQYAAEAYKVYAFFCNPDKNPTFHDATLRLRDFMFMMKDFHLIDEYVTAQALIALLSADDPGIVDPDSGNYSLEAEMTFLEFFETLVGCSQLAPLAQLGKKAGAAGGRSAFALSARASVLEEEDEGERAASASHPSGEGNGERTGSQTGSQVEGTGEEDKDSGGTAGDGGEGGAAEGGMGVITGSGSRAGTGTPGAGEADGMAAGSALSPDQEGKLEGESANSQDGGVSPTGDVGGVGGGGGAVLAESPINKKTPSRRSRTVISSQAGDEGGSQAGDAPTPHGSAMGLMEQILHTTDADDKALEDQMISPEEAEFQEWCAKLRQFFESHFFPAAEEYKQICRRCFDTYGNNFLNVDIKEAVDARLAEEKEALESVGVEDFEDPDVMEEPETRRPSFRTQKSHVSATNVGGVPGGASVVNTNANKVTLNVQLDSRRLSTQPSLHSRHSSSKEPQLS